MCVPSATNGLIAATARPRDHSYRKEPDVSKHLRRSLAAAATILSVSLAGCTQYVATPEITQMRPEPIPDADLDAVLARITPPVIGDGTQFESHPAPRASVDQLRAGEDLGFGVTMSREAEELWIATGQHDWQRWEERYDAARASLPDTPGAHFLLSAQRVRAMLHAGRIDDVRRELEVLERLEREIFGNVLETTSQYAQLNSWLNNSRESVAYNAAVVDAVGKWWLPSFYYAKPENTGDAKRVAGALMRAHIGLTCEHIVLHDYPASMAWGRAGLDMTEDVLATSHHPLYGFFVKTTPYMYEGQAWMLTCYTAGRLGVSRNLEANLHLIERSKAFFRQAGYRWGDELVDSIMDYVMYDTGMKPQRTEVVGILGDPAPATPERLANLVRFRPDNLQVREGIELPVPEPSSIELPGEGAVNAYGFIVGPDLAAANAAILNGDYGRAAGLYDRVARAESDPLRRWHAAQRAVQALILAGRSAEAIGRIPALETLEQAYFGTNAGARSLRGEAKFWLGDNEGALRDFLHVVEAFGDYRPPALLLFKPQIPQLALLSRTQFRAYLGVARSQLYMGDYAGALPWAEAAEELFEETHYTWQHQLYSEYLKLDADMFYGRGVNLAVMAGSQLVLGRDADAAESVLDSARSYLQAMNFDAGLTTIEATWARALLDADQPARAAAVAREAAVFAAERGQADLLWQVEALRGEALARLGEDAEAEKAFRAAQAAIEAVSGALATDSSKRRFGIGKEEITNRLVAYSLGRGDHADAFKDLEQGRARAFVDMLGQTDVNAGANARLVEDIRALGRDIRAARVQISAPGHSDPVLARQIRQLSQKRSAGLDRLRDRDPELADAMSVSARSLREVQRAMGARDLMLYALPIEDGSALIRFLAIRRSGAEVIETALTPDALEALLVPFSTDDPLGLATRQAESATRIGAQIGLADWAPGGVLYVVPSGPLYFLPWGALAIDSPVVVLPTGGWITRRPAPISGSRAAIVGDPDLGLGWQSLPGARDEATGIAEIYGVAALTDRDATVEALRSRVGSGVRVLHLATHGVFDARDPLASAVLLSDGAEAERLTAASLFEKPLPAALVVMSACETGVGQVTAGDDFLGLTRSFYLGGARAVVNSLWPVHDKPTRLFMDVFHREAVRGDLGKAWLAARNRLRDEGFPPSIYGAFVLGGSARL